MKQVVIALLLLSVPVLAAPLLSAPVLAETPAPPASADELDQGLSLMEQGAQMLLEHLMGKVEPSLNDMTDALKEVQPKLMELMAMMDDIKNFHAPELMPNGDIIIRRKTPAELKLQELQGGETEL